MRCAACNASWDLSVSLSNCMTHNSTGLPELQGKNPEQNCSTELEINPAAISSQGCAFCAQKQTRSFNFTIFEKIIFHRLGAIGGEYAQIVFINGIGRKHDSLRRAGHGNQFGLI